MKTGCIVAHRSFRPGSLGRAAACILSLMLLVVQWPTDGLAAELKPYKDKFFSYPDILETQDDGAFIKIDYQELRDINGRDQIPERRVQRKYVSLKPKRQQRSLDIRSGPVSVKVYETGRKSKARFAVIFVHGRGGDRKLGYDDWSFGGNFNRLKNLAVNNAGVYYTPSFSDFGDAGYAELLAVVDHIAGKSPNAPIILACGSMGSFLCWRAAHEVQFAPRLAGLVILGGARDDRYLTSAAFESGRPVLFAHGSRDSVYEWRQQYQLYDKIRRANPGYPVRFVLFNSGSHGTPIRMIDWRDTLNWILSQ